MISDTYYLVRQINKQSSPDIKRVFSIAKFIGHNEPTETGIVREFYNGRFDSDDIGFMCNRETKRIRIIKKHIELGEPILTAYWQNEDKEIEYTNMGSVTNLKDLNKYA